MNERQRDGATERPSEKFSPSRRLSFSLSPYFWCFGALLAALLLSAAIGAVAIPPLDVARLLIARGLSLPTDVSDTFATILFDIRLPRTILVAITGAALSGSGAAYQGLFRNPLADPYLLGIASGAGLGAVAAMAIQWPSSAISFLAVPIAAFLGALLTALLVYSLARVGRTTPISTLLLAGVAVGAFMTALSTFLMLRSQGELRRAIGWMLGGFALGGWSPVLAVLPEIIIGLGVLLLVGRPLNVLQFGDDQARQLGLNVDRVKRIVIIAASLTTAAAVAFSGIIGFVGLAVPHLVRLLWGGDYRRLMP
ncbi:MAG: iron chelate uptake ABC transporter family permease subunit, partial [Thermoflexales bacterium]|nr:iron chelate uptake ABC transporter family permease subunit [Thermoflexales bacterium]